MEFYPSEDEAAQYRLIWLTPAEGDFSEKRLIRWRQRRGIFSMAARDFTSLYPEYQVEFVDYEAQYGEQADQQLFMDLLYGDCPDLLFVNGLPVAPVRPSGTSGRPVRMDRHGRNAFAHGLHTKSSARTGNRWRTVPPAADLSLATGCRSAEIVGAAGRAGP